MKATFSFSDGNSVEVDAPPGTSLMQAATLNGVPGIIADCGGTASCATCHVFVDEAFLDLLSPPNFNEEQVLDCTAAERQPNSRLACQIIMREELSGIRVLVADPQL